MKKNDLYLAVETARDERLRKTRKELNELIEQQKEIDFIKLTHLPQFAPLNKTVRKLMSQLAQIDDELLEELRLRRSSSIAMYEQVTTYEEWINLIRNRVGSRALNDDIVEKRKEINSVNDEYNKLIAYIKSHTPSQSLSFLRDLGFEIEEVKREVEVINVNKEFL